MVAMVIRPGTIVARDIHTDMPRKAAIDFLLPEFGHDVCFLPF